MRQTTILKLTASATQRNDLKGLIYPTSRKTERIDAVMIRESKVSKVIDAVTIAMLTLIALGTLNLLISLFINL